MSATDPGLPDAVQRAMRDIGCVDRGHGLAPWCVKHHRFFEDGGCPVAQGTTRAARSDVPDLIRQAKADALEDFAEHDILRQTAGRIVEDMRDRAAKIREGLEL